MAMLLAAMAVVAAASASTRPNVILLMADDQGWGDVGYNNLTGTHSASHSLPRWTPNAPRTPNLDAMARSDGSIVFWRWYAGSAVCSPSRSAAMTGRSNDRECIAGAEPHGYGPAWSCFSPLPLSPRTFTIAEAAKAAGYETFHAGKWHLGDFFPKRAHGEPSSFASDKWPVSNPGTHGFDEWHSTEASGPTSTPNCGCDAGWQTEGQGCICGGGVWRKNRTWVCMNYWTAANGSGADPACRSARNATRSCVANSTAKIEGDDAEHIVDAFEGFLDRRQRKHARRAQGATQAAAAPFLAVLWLHTIHFPRGAMPQYFNAYKDSFGDPAGDYLGSITQMDVQVGRLRQLLRDRQLADGTTLWYSSDNGPNVRTERTPGNEVVAAPRDRSKQPQYAATNGLRACKASLYEGGIRVPGILEWPGVIKRHAETFHPAYHADYLSTFLAVSGTVHPQPAWAADGMSLLPLIEALATSGAMNDTSHRERPLVFQLGKQSALIDNDWKIVDNPSAGDCEREPGSLSGRRLYDVASDPTESVDLSRSAAHAELFANMSSRLDEFKRSVENSAVNESQCKRAPDVDIETTSFEQAKIQPACHSPLAPDPPGPPPGPSFELRSGGACLAASQAAERAPLALVACSPKANSTQRWQLSSHNVLVLKGGFCAKPDWNTGGGKLCSKGVPAWLGTQNCRLYGFSAPSDGVIRLAGGCPASPLCLARGGNGTVVLAACSDPAAAGWAAVKVGRVLKTTNELCSRQPPKRSFSVSLATLGATTAGKDNVAAFEKGVRLIAAKKGGELVVPAGTWTTSPFNFTSHMTLRIEAGGVVLGSPIIADHAVLPPLPTYGAGRDNGNGHYTSLLHGQNLTDVALVGPGVVDGNGAVWWAAHKRSGYLKFTRGHLVEFINSAGLHISSVTLRNSPFWTVHPYYSSDVYACALTISNPSHSPNTDGFDPDSSRDVLLEHSKFDVGDDCVAIKSGWDCFGYRPGLAKASENIVIKNLTCTSPTSAGICIGSEMSGGVRNVTVIGFTGLNVSTGLRLKSGKTRGGFIKDISMSNVHLNGAKIAVQVNAFYGSRNARCPAACLLFPTAAKCPGYAIPVVANISMRHWRGASVTQAADLEGLSAVHKSTGISFSDFQVDTEAKWKCSAVSGTAADTLPSPAKDCPQIMVVPKHVRKSDDEPNTRVSASVVIEAGGSMRLGRHSEQLMGITAYGSPASMSRGRSSSCASWASKASGCRLWSQNSRRRACPRWRSKSSSPLTIPRLAQAPP